MKHYDLCVIGAGSGGVRAARMASQSGAKVAIVEEGSFGGTCVNLGCVPKKLYVIASSFGKLFKLSHDYGWSQANPEFAFDQLKRAKDAEISRLNSSYQSLLDNSQVTSYVGHAKLAGDGIVNCGEHKIKADRILIATGSRATLPIGLSGIELGMISDDIFALEKLPHSIAIYGGGYIAVEFACLFHSLGVATHLIYRGEQLFKHFDRETAMHASKSFQNNGLNIHLTTTIKSIAPSQSGRLLTLQSAQNNSLLEVEQILLATGRSANSDNLGIQELGIQTRNDGSIIVDDCYQTNLAGVFALGDVTGGFQLTPVAIAEAMDFVRQQFDPASKHRLPKYMPTVIFSQPNIATVGISEEQALIQINNLVVFTSIFTPLPQSLSKHNQASEDIAVSSKTYMKILVDQDTDKVVGMHMVGESAGEIIQGFAAAMEAGLTKTTLDRTLGIHPTTAEEFVSIYQSSR